MLRRLSRKRVRLIPGRYEGQSLLLVAVLLPLLLIFLAFVVDGAHAFVDYRHAQNAADAASLAAAQDLNSPSCAGPQLQCIQDMVTDYAYQNGFWPNDHTGSEIPQCLAGGQLPADADACFEWPYNGNDPTRVLVKIRGCTKLLIGSFF